MVEPIRVAMIMGKMIGGGVESVVLNYYRHMDHSKIQFDFIIDNDSKIVPVEEIEKLGGKIIRISPYQNILTYMKDLGAVFKENNYDIVHSHMNTLSVFPLKVAKDNNIGIRIAHNHSTAAHGELKKNVMKKFLSLFSNLYPTHYMSPSKYAGEWLFGKKVEKKNFFILKNAIDVKRFKYDEIKRKEMRLKLGLSEDDFVIGNIGRMVWQKNQKFVIKVFNDVLKERDAKLLIIGDGPLKEELRSQVRQFGIEKSVIFLSNFSNIQDYYQVMDYFLFPSNYEGLGMVAIEAQVSGLPVLGSSVIPEDAKISNLFVSMPLHRNSEHWAREILDARQSKRLSRVDQAISKGYDISYASIELQNYYISLVFHNNENFKELPLL